MQTIITKLTKQITTYQLPTICFSDIDGTVFTPDIRLLNAPLCNTQSKNILEKSSIPFVLSTGRIFWNKFYDIEMNLHGLPQPDAIIIGAGIKILFRTNTGKLEEDTNWLKDKKPLKNYQLTDFTKYTIFKQKNPHLFVGFVKNISLQQLNTIIDDLKKRYGHDTKIFYGESLVHTNTTTLFSGNIFIANADKGDAMQYVLKHILQTTNYKLQTLVFGDAMIDFPMFLLPSTKQYDIKPYLVYPTALAHQEAETYKQITVINNQGPQAILDVLKTTIVGAKQSRQQSNNETIEHLPLSPAQNNNARLVLKLFEPILNNIIAKNLSPNDISFVGLKKTIQGINETQNKSLFYKLHGYYLYILGNLADVFDGIRARQSLQSTNYKLHTDYIPGQLVDVFCDRVKEFYQLYSRAKKRFIINKEEGSQTLLSSISCILPSLARAQAEIQNIIVEEKDEKGGSMIDRTKLLISSMYFSLIDMDKKSLEIDEKIFQQNIATYNNRIQKLQPTNYELPTNVEKQKFFQRAALERFLLLVQIFQEEYDLITKFLKTDPAFALKFKKAIQPYNKYLVTHVGKLRKKYNIQTYNVLSLQKYLQ